MPVASSLLGAILVGATLCTANPLHAESSVEMSTVPNRGAPPVTVSVRVIQAGGRIGRGAELNPSAVRPLPGDAAMGVNMFQPRSPNLTYKIDPRLSDIREKLMKLPFLHFRMIGQQQSVVSLKRKYIIDLPGGHVLALRPLYVEGPRVGMWMRWRERDGADVLDTRVHFNCGESMITGTDNAYGGAVLAITVSPQH